MATKYTLEELKKTDSSEKDIIILSLQDKVDKLSENVEKLIEQVRLANQNRFGRSTEKLSEIDGQLSLFDEAEANYDEDTEEPDINDLFPSEPHKAKSKGKRKKDLEGFPREHHTHPVSEEQLNEFFGEGNWKKLPDDEYDRLRYEPASWTVEHHSVEVYVGTDGLHQDEFFRGDRPKDLLRNSILTPSLAAAILNGKYVNSLPFDRIEQEFKRNGINIINKQNMSNWTINLANRYFEPFCKRMKYHMLLYHVNQCDETPCQVLNDGGSPGSKSHMWVHRSGELYRDKRIVLYEYQKGRDHHIPLEYYRGFEGVLVSDALAQYHLVDKKTEGITNANCWAHARRDFSDAIKIATNKKSPAIKQSVAYQALLRIGMIYKLDEPLKELSVKERYKERQRMIKPLVDEFFKWVKEQVATMLPKGKTMDGLNYCINQEKYLRVFLEDGEVPIDNSASERALRTFCIGKKNWLFFDSPRGASAGALVYSISETAKLNNLKPYKYFEYILTELPKLCDKDGNIEQSKLDYLMPWSPTLPDDCRKPEPQP
jgi:hypothetical protein